MIFKNIRKIFVIVLYLFVYLFYAEIAFASTDITNQCDVLPPDSPYYHCATNTPVQNSNKENVTYDITLKSAPATFTLASGSQSLDNISFEIHTNIKNKPFYIWLFDRDDMSTVLNSDNQGVIKGMFTRYPKQGVDLGPIFGAGSWKFQIAEQFSNTSKYDEPSYVFFSFSIIPHVEQLNFACNFDVASNENPNNAFLSSSEVWIHNGTISYPKNYFLSTVVADSTSILVTDSNSNKIPISYIDFQNDVINHVISFDGKLINANSNLAYGTYNVNVTTRFDQGQGTSIYTFNCPVKTFPVFAQIVTPTLTPIPSPTLVIPAACNDSNICVYPLNCQNGSQPKSICTTCPQCVHQPTSTVFLQDLCDNIANPTTSPDENKKCHACIDVAKTPYKPLKPVADNPQRIWTAIGCVPTDVPTILSQYVLGATGLGIAGGVGFLYFLYGAFLVLTSMGNAEKINEGKEIMMSSIWGILLIIFSIFLLKVVAVQVLRIPGFE